MRHAAAILLILAAASLGGWLGQQQQSPPAPPLAPPKQPRAARPFAVDGYPLGSRKTAAQRKLYGAAVYIREEALNRAYAWDYRTEELLLVHGQTLSERGAVLLRFRDPDAKVEALLGPPDRRQDWRNGETPVGFQWEYDYSGFTLRFAFRFENFEDQPTSGPGEMLHVVLARPGQLDRPVSRY